MKNTMGYGVNAFLDFETPADILAHLMVGSEGTLAFVLGATYRTVPVYPHVATALLVLDSIDAATVISMLEDDLDIRVLPQDFAKLRTVNDIVGYLVDELVPLDS